MIYIEGRHEQPYCQESTPLGEKTTFSEAVYQEITGYRRVRLGLEIPPNTHSRGFGG
jgi:hypothetical protein